MPELPEVLHFKHYIESTALNQPIEDAEVLNEQILTNCSEQEFKKQMAGIGNEQSDEILFQSGIHPKTKVRNLSVSELQILFDKLKMVVEIKVECLDHDQKMPDDFLLHHKVEGEECPVCGGSIEKITVGGRSGYFCPACQN